MSEDKLPLSDRQIAAALAMADLWPGKGRDEVLAEYFDLHRSPEAARRREQWIEQDGKNGPGLPPTELVDAREVLLPALLETEKRFLQIPRQWPGVFRRAWSVMDYERSVEMEYTGLAQLRAPIGRTPHDGGAGSEQFVYQCVHHHIGLSAKLGQTPEGELDVASVGPVAYGLANSFAQTEEVLHANLFNSGRAYNPSTLGDGVPLFAPNHPYHHGVYSNADAYDLNQASLEHIHALVRAFPDHAGLRINARMRKLIVPVELEFTAARLLRDPDVQQMLPEGYQVLDFLRSKTAWFVLTTLPGLDHFARHPFRLNIGLDKGRLVLEATQAYGVCHNDPRSCFGSFPGEAA